MKITERKIRLLIRRTLLNEINCNDPANRTDIRCARQSIGREPGTSFSVRSDGTVRATGKITQAMLNNPEIRRYKKMQDVEEFLDKPVKAHLEDLLTGTVELAKGVVMDPFKAQAKLKGTALELMYNPTDQAEKDFKDALGNFAYQGVLYSLPAGYFGKAAKRNPGIKDVLRRRNRRGSTSLSGKTSIFSKKYPVQKTPTATVTGKEKIQQALKSVIKDDGTRYHVHVVNKPQYNEAILRNGVALRKNRKGTGYRATTYNNDVAADTINRMRVEPVKNWNNNKIIVVYKVPTGKTLKDMTKTFKGPQPYASKHGPITATIDNKHLHAFVDRTGTKDILYVFD